MRDALTAFRRLDVAPDVAVALIDLREILGPEHPDSRRLVAEAEAIIERLRAQSLSRRLDRVLAADAGGAGTLARPAPARRAPPQGVAARTPSG
jgi:hypothetical protein